jgi:hypothetical protein
MPTSKARMVDLHEALYLLRELRKRALFLSFIGVMCANSFVWRQKWFERFLKMRWPAQWFYIVVWVGLIVITLVRSRKQRRILATKPINISALIRLEQIHVRESSFTMMWGVWLLLYVTGLRELIASMLVKLIPAVGTALRSSLPTLVEWVCAGVAGNAVYDYLKRKLEGVRASAPKE